MIEGDLPGEAGSEYIRVTKTTRGVYSWEIKVRIKPAGVLATWEAMKAELRKVDAELKKEYGD